MRVKVGDGDWVSPETTPIAVELSNQDLMNIIESRFIKAESNALYGSCPDNVWDTREDFLEWAGLDPNGNPKEENADG